MTLKCSKLCSETTRLCLEVPTEFRTFFCFQKGLMCKCKQFTQKSATSFLEVVKKGHFHTMYVPSVTLLRPNAYFQKLKHQQGCLLNTGLNGGSARIVQFGEGNHLPLMWLRFTFWHQHHNYVGWVCFWFSSCSERLFYKYSDFHLSSSNISNSSLTTGMEDKEPLTLDVLPIIILFSYLFCLFNVK